MARLTETRGLIFRLRAAQRAIDYPCFGLTSVLDPPGVELPPQVAGTVAGLDSADILRGCAA